MADALQRKEKIKEAQEALRTKRKRQGLVPMTVFITEDHRKKLRFAKEKGKHSYNALINDALGLLFDEGVIIDVEELARSVVEAEEEESNERAAQEFDEEADHRLMLGMARELIEAFIDELFLAYESIKSSSSEQDFACLLRACLLRTGEWDEKISKIIIDPLLSEPSIR